MSEIQKVGRKISLMTEKEQEDHTIVAMSLDWCDLAAIIIELELELYELKPYMTKEEVAHREGVIWIYEVVKARAVAAHSRGIEYVRQVIDKELFGEGGLNGEDY